jgi:methionyl-tRNA formyltransferase
MFDISKTRVVFMGTPRFAETVLQSLIDARYHIVAVYTQPDKPSGREQEVVKSPVKILAEAQQIPIEQPSRLDGNAIDTFASYKPDVVVIAAYGKLIPKAMLEVPRFGFLNVHASLLPRWRGASPIQNALLSGDTETGVSIMLLDQGMDTGPVFERKSVSIAPNDTTEILLPKLAEAGSTLLLSVLPEWLEKRREPTPQDETTATLCQLIEREDGKVFWNDNAETIYNRYRALSSWPGIFSFWRRNGSLLRVKLHRVSLQKQSPEIHHELGQVFEIGDRVGIQTARGIILLDEVQLEGKERVDIADFIRGYPDFIGAILE